MAQLAVSFVVYDQLRHVHSHSNPRIVGRKKEGRTSRRKKRRETPRTKTRKKGKDRRACKARSKERTTRNQTVTRRRKPLTR
jgi:hypothetical protein